VTDGQSTPQDLLDFLGARLPEYLVPATMTVLDRLPLRPSGKLDRDALPSPQ
jgi:acyl-CoA synthetase (AMP-forming)/AMP-acid ligase II